MNEIEEVNKVLEILGSDYHAEPSSMISTCMAAIVKALPAYIEKVVEQRLSEQRKR